MKPTKFNCQAGFNLFEVIVIVAVVTFLVVMAIPNFVRARTSALTNACISNLSLIDAAKQQWALEKNQSSNAIPTSADLLGYMGRTSLDIKDIYCPLATKRTPLDGYVAGINPVCKDPVCANYNVERHPASLHPAKQ